MSTKIIELKDMEGNILLPYAYSASHDSSGNNFETVYATKTLVNTKADDNSVVHLTGNEVITGVKTINVPTTGTNLIFKSDLIDTSATPEENIYQHIDYRDKNDNLLARIFECRDIYGANVLALQAWNGSTQHWIGVNSSGYGVAPTPSDASDNSTKIATTAWVNSHIDVNPNIVRTTGLQTITGAKTFDSNNADWDRYNLNLRNTAHTRAEALAQDDGPKYPASIQLGWSDRIVGWIENYCRNNLSVTSIVSSTTNGDETAHYSAIRAISDGSTLYTYAPPSDINNSIVTTVAKSKAANGYFKLGNGMIIQWGRGSINEQTTQDVTLPTPFSNTNYAVIAGQGTASTAGDAEVAVGAQIQSATVIRLYSHYINPNTVTYYWIAFGY